MHSAWLAVCFLADERQNLLSDPTMSTVIVNPFVPNHAYFKAFDREGTIDDREFVRAV